VCVCVSFISHCLRQITLFVISTANRTYAKYIYLYKESLIYISIYIYIYVCIAVGSSKFVQSSTGFNSLFFFRNVMFQLLNFSVLVKLFKRLFHYLDPGIIQYCIVTASTDRFL